VPCGLPLAILTEGRSGAGARGTGSGTPWSVAS
jgi:hypothetical protein